MNGYLFSVVCAAVVSAVICALAPDSKGINKLIGFVASLCVAAAVLSPVIGFDASLPDFSDMYTQGTADKEGEERARYYARQSVYLLCSYYGVDADKIKATVEFDGDYTVTLRFDGRLLNPRVAEKKLTELLDIEVILETQ